MELLTEILKRITVKFGYALKGLNHALHNDKSIQLQFLLAGLAVVFFLLLEISLFEWMWIISAIFLVIICEFINSCLENICNLVHPMPSDKIAVIKDMGSAFVLLSAIYSLIVGFVIISRYM